MARVLEKYRKVAQSCFGMHLAEATLAPPWIAVVQYPVRAGAEPWGGGGLVQKSRLRLGVPHPISAPGRLPKTVFLSIFGVLGVVSFLCLSEEKRDRADAADARGFVLLLTI